MVAVSGSPFLHLDETIFVLVQKIESVAGSALREFVERQPAIFILIKQGEKGCGILHGFGGDSGILVKGGLDAAASSYMRRRPAAEEDHAVSSHGRGTYQGWQPA